MTDKPVSELQEKFIDALFDTKGSVPRAADLVGISTASAYGLVKGSLRKLIIQRAEEILALYGPRAVFTLADSVDECSEVPMSPIRLEGAKQILDRIGIIKKEQIDINANVNTPLFILPAKDDASN